VLLAILDRDGVLTEAIGRDVTRPEDLRLLPGAARAVAWLNRAGVAVAVCTNQDVVGRGEIDVETLNRIHAKLRQDLSLEGARLDALFCCIDDPRFPTPKRKPGSGMLEEALACFGARPGRTPVIGDKLADLQAAHGLGCPRHLVRTGEGAATERQLPSQILPVRIHDCVFDAVSVLLRRRPEQQPVKASRARSR
jgi:D-glycero-D-manno-heptose 1,7-bisphosphate phosphatase